MNAHHGLPSRTVAQIEAVFAQYPQVEQVVLYGSRAKGNFKNGSDIDLCMMGEQIDDALVLKIAGELDDLPIPYTVDLSTFHLLDHAKLREHIERVGVVFYEKKAQGLSKLNFGTDMKQGDTLSLQKGWEITEFEKCLEKVTYSNKIQRKDFKEDGIYPIVSQEKDFINGYWDNEEDLFKVDKPVVIFGDHTQVIKFIDFDFVLGADGVKILKPKDEIDSKYFYYFLQNIDLGNLGYARHYRLLKEINVAYPKSLPEQQRIVSILDEAFAAIAKAKANAEQNLKNAKELFESYLQGVFEKKGDGWEERTLEEMADEKCTLSYGIVQPGEEFENGLPVIRPTDLTSRYIKVEGLKRIDPKLADGYKRTKLIGDELLLCVRGTTGVVSIATPELKDANVTRGIVPIRFNPKILNQEFGYYLLISNYVQKQIRAKTYGAALMQINIGDLRKILTPYPSLKEQQTIVRQLDALRAETQKLEALYQKKIDDLEELKKSILQKAFAGEL